MGQKATHASIRKRGAWLQDFRRRHFLLQPCCVECEKEDPPRYTVGDVVDHKVALTNGGKDFDEDPDNAQTLCNPHHDIKTATDLGYSIRSGGDASGQPSDPSHHWNRARK